MLYEFQTEVFQQFDLPEVVFVTETWFGSSFPDSMIPHHNEYSIYRKDRSDDHGGVMIMVKRNIKFWEINRKSFDSMEFICVKCKMRKCHLTLACFYRVSVNDTDILDPLKNALEYVCNSRSSVLLAGDFNLPDIQWNSCPPIAPTRMRQKEFLKLFSMHSLTQYVQDATRGERILDLVFCNDKSLLKSVDNLSPMSTTCDHSMLKFCLCVERDECDCIKVYNWSKADFACMCLEMELKNWKDILSGCDDVNDMWNVFCRECKQLISKHVPIATRRYRGKVSNEVRKLIKRKQVAYKQRNRSPQDMAFYKNVSNLCKGAVWRHAMENEQTMLSNPSTQAFFRYVNGKLNNKNAISCLTKCSGEPVHDEFEMAEMFNAQYASVFTHDNHNPLHFPQKSDNCLSESQFLITRDAIVDSIRKMKAKTSAGPDGIPNIFYKRCRKQVAVPLEMIYSKSIVSETLPSEWKNAIVVPIYKGKGDKCKAINYRPVSLTCVGCRILERIINDHITNFLNENELMHKTQYGFERNKSTVTQMVECMDDWTKAMDSRIPVDVIYIDVSKAFDTVVHRTLLQKLESYGIDGKILAWIKSFLSNRKQRVRVGNQLSNSVNIISGVPQGSVLGPRLFNIYINDMHEACLYTILMLFADDAKLYALCPDDVSHAKLVEDFERILAWFETNQLKVATDKCSVLHIGNNNPRRSIKIGANEVRSENYVRDLGVIISENLQMNKHHQHVISKASMMANLIYRTFISRSEDFLVSMFKTYVLPKLNYATLLYSPHVKQDIEDIETVQRNFLKRIPSMRYNSYEERLERAQLITLEERRVVDDLVFAYKCLHGQVNLSKDILTLSHNTQTRSNGRKLKKDKFRTDIRKYFFTNRVVDIWNQLPKDIANAPTVGSFKTKLKSFDLKPFLIFKP